MGCVKLQYIPGFSSYLVAQDSPHQLYKIWPGSKQGNKEALKNNENHTEFC
jgi:hypothetical protein